MTKKIVLSLVVFGATAFAGDNNFKVSLTKDSVIDGKAIQAGAYEVSMANGYAVFKHGSYSIQVPAREETEATKAAATEFLYTHQTELEGIHLGGTKTAILFGVATSPNPGL